jgi:hypothetical protein
MDRISDRHGGTLDGRLAPVDTVRPATVSVEIAPGIAGLLSCQHTAWMLVNLLARQERIVERVLLDCPAGVPLSGRVVPLASRDADLRTALLDGAAAIAAVPVVTVAECPAGAIRIVVGPGLAIEGAMRVHGERWWGGISRAAIPGPHASSGLPYGPYAAACLAAGEVYKAVRLALPKPVMAAFYSTWSLRAMAAPPSAAEDIGPHAIDGLEIEAITAGGGAVGNTWVHVTWATEGIHGRVIVADSDKRGVDLSNLNRCPALGADSIGKPKATEAAIICADASIEIIPFDGPVGDVQDRPDLLLCAVDTNTSRRAVQGLYPPRLLRASTHNLRAEILRCDSRAGAPCVSCFNPPEADISDMELRREYLAADPAERQRLASAVNLSVDDADRWATEGTCSFATDRLLDQLRESHEGPHAFAVGFVSVMAGVMLAAQTIRELIGDRSLQGTMCRAVMQFLDPSAASNAPRRQRRDATCPMCSPHTFATRIWRQRYHAWSPPLPAARDRDCPDSHSLT